MKIILGTSYAHANADSLLHPLQQLTSSLIVKQAAKMNVPGAKPIYEDLKVRFERPTRRKTEPEPAN